MVYACMKQSLLRSCSSAVVVVARASAASSRDAKNVVSVVAKDQSCEILVPWYGGSSHGE